MQTPDLGPPARGERVPYAELPEAVHRWVDRTLGARVTGAATQHSGFSPGVAARLVCADGRRAFVKAVSAERNALSVTMHRREAEIVAALPPGLPVPRLLATYDDGNVVALLFEDIDGRHPQLPWRTDELAAVLAVLDRLAGALTPSPVPAEPLTVTHAEDFQGWRTLAARAPRGLDDWSRCHLDRLAALEPAWVQACAGDTLLHVDTRADNLLLDAAGSVWLVDWPWASLGPAWADLALFAPSVAMQGGPDPDELLAGRVDRETLAAFVCAVAGLFTERSLRPPPPGIPTLRAFQAAQGHVARRWLAELTGWS